MAALVPAIPYRDSPVLADSCPMTVDARCRPVAGSREGPLSGTLRLRFRLQAIDHVEARDSRTGQQQRRVTLFLTEDCHQNIVDPNFVFSAGLYVEHGALQDPLEAKLWLHGVVLPWQRNPQQIIGRDVMLEVGAELIGISAASVEDLAHPGRIEDREQEMLDGQKFMVRAARLMKRLTDASLKIARQHSLGPHIHSVPIKSVRFWAVYLWRGPSASGRLLLPAAIAARGRPSSRDSQRASGRVAPMGTSRCGSVEAPHRVLAGLWRLWG